MLIHEVFLHTETDVAVRINELNPGNYLLQHDCLIHHHLFLEFKKKNTNLKLANLGSCYSLVPWLSPHTNVLQATESWAGPGNEATETMT